MSMTESIRKSLRLQEDDKMVVMAHLPGTKQESVATTIYHDFYGSRTGINNRIPICPFCLKPRSGGIYDNELALTNGTCKCDPDNPNASK